MVSRIDCEEAVAKLLEFLDGELDPAAEREMERHLETCRGCFSRAELERRLKRLVAETGRVRAPDSLRRRVRGIIERF